MFETKMKSEIIKNITYKNSMKNESFTFQNTIEIVSLTDDDSIKGTNTST